MGIAVGIAVAVDIAAAQSQARGKVKEREQVQMWEQGWVPQVPTHEPPQEQGQVDLQQ